MRQWVLSVPFELRLLLARNPLALGAVGRIFVQEISRWQRGRAATLDPARARTGAVCFPQRFGGSLNLNVHYHVAAPDGVFTLDDGAERVTFHAGPCPAQGDLETIALNVAMRVLAWLRRSGLIVDEYNSQCVSGQERTRTALDACLEGSLGLGELTALPAGETRGLDDDQADVALPHPTKAARRGGHAHGFALHAGVVVLTGDREGRERLLRYCARPPLSLERLSALRDGRVAYAIRKPWGRQTGTTGVRSPVGGIGLPHDGRGERPSHTWRVGDRR